MNVVLLAWCPSAAVYVDAITEAGARLRLTVTGASASAADALGPPCERAGVPLERCQDINDPAFVHRVWAIGTDLLLVAGCAQILGQPLRRAATFGAVNLHPSLLPSYRGKEPLFWTILRGEPRAGITAHRVTDAIDAGPILLARAIDVPPRSTSASLADALDRIGAGLLPELFALVAAAGPPTDVDDPPEIPDGTSELSPAPSYFPPLRPEHGLVDWARDAAEIERLVRACSGEIRAYTFFRGMKLILLQAEIAPDEVRGAPGTVLGVEHGAILIRAATGVIAAPRWLFLDRPKTGEELAIELEIRAGSRFASNPAF